MKNPTSGLNINISSVLDDNFSPVKGGASASIFVVDIDKSAPCKSLLSSTPPSTKETTKKQTETLTDGRIRLSYHGVGPPQNTMQFGEVHPLPTPVCRGVHKICIAMSIDCDVSIDDLRSIMLNLHQNILVANTIGGGCVYVCMTVEAHTSTETKQACCQLFHADHGSIDSHQNCILQAGYTTIQGNKKLHVTLIFRDDEEKRVERGSMGGGKYTSMISIQWFLQFATEKQADYLLVIKQSVRLTPTTLLMLYRRVLYEPNIVSVASRQRILIPSNFYHKNLHALFYAVCQQYHIESHRGSEAFADCMLFDVPSSLCNVSKREKKQRLSTYKKPDVEWSDEDDQYKDHTDIRESPMKTPTTSHITHDQSATDVMDAFEKLSDSFAVLASVGHESSLPIRLLAYTSSLLSTTTSSSSQCFSIKTCVEESNAVVLVVAESTVEAAMSRQKQVFLDDFFGCVWLLLTVGTLHPLRSTKTNRLPSFQGTIVVAKAVMQLYLHCSGVTIGLVILTETLGQAVETYYQSTVIGNYYVIGYLVLYLLFPVLILNRRGILSDAWIVVLDVFIVLNAILAFLFIQSLFHIILMTTSILISKIVLAIVTSIIIFSPLLRACMANDYSSAWILLQSWIPHIIFLPTRFILVPIHALFNDMNVSQHVMNPAWALCLLNATLAGLSRMLRVVTLSDMTLLSVLLQAFIYNTFLIGLMTTMMRENRWNCNQCFQRYKYQKKSPSDQATLDLRRRFGDNREDIQSIIASIRLMMGDDNNDITITTNAPTTTAKNTITNDNDMMI